MADISDFHDVIVDDSINKTVGAFAGHKRAKSLIGLIQRSSDIDKIFQQLDLCKNLDYQRIQVKIFRDDCSYCMDTVDTQDEDDCDPDETALTSGGDWTSEFTDSPELTITAGGSGYDLSSDGLSLICKNSFCRGP